MFISVLDLFKIGIGPSSSHTMGPMVAANDFLRRLHEYLQREIPDPSSRIRCTLKGSLSATGKGHATDRAIALGLHGHLPSGLAERNVEILLDEIWRSDHIEIDNTALKFSPSNDIVFDHGPPFPQHPNGMIFELLDGAGNILLSEIYFSIGGGFISKANEIAQLAAPIPTHPTDAFPYPFDSAQSMLEMAAASGLSIAEMKHRNELARMSEPALIEGLDTIWEAMERCVENGLHADGVLPGGLGIERRARSLYRRLRSAEQTDLNDWMCAYAMAVNEENANGHMVVTAPTNGAAGVVPAVLYYLAEHMAISREQIREFLLTAAAIGGLIKHLSSISGAEVGCQGEVGSASAMAAAGLCAVRGGTAKQIEHAAEIALEHHLGMTCDPVKGLVQVPCIERNGFGAIKAWTAASLAMHGDGRHFMSLDKCIAAMKQTGAEMSVKFKETSLGGLAVTITEC